jgi:hypothetical protein
LGACQISKRFEGNFSISSIIKFSFESLTSEKDAKELETFFEVCPCASLTAPTDI